MCIKNYVGYHCGHRDPEGTEMKTDYCRRPYRYEHEPPCVFKYCLHVRVNLRRPRDSDFCPACRQLRAELWKEWGDTFTQWSKERIVPSRDQAVTHARIQDMFQDVEQLSTRAVFLQGPDHTVQNQYRERLHQSLQPLELQVTRLRAADHEWKLKMTQAKSDGKVSQITLELLEVNRKRLFELTRPLAWSVNMLLERQTQLLGQLKAAAEKPNNKGRVSDPYGKIE